MKRKLYLRIDVDSYICLKKGVPQLLKLFKKNNIKATFFITLGREGNIYEYLKYKHFRAKKTPLKLKKIRPKFWQITKILLFPSNLYKEKKILREIIKNNHELEIHCFNHIKWWDPNYSEAKKDLKKAISYYKRITGENPSGFASPYGSWNKDIAKLLKKSDFKYISIHNEKKTPTICKECKKLNIPITISPKEHCIPICEYFKRKGFKGRELVKHSLNYFNKEAKGKKFLSIYIHPRIEGVEIFQEFSEFIKELNKNYDLTGTFNEIRPSY